jgi:hypothetical protein
MIDFVTNKNATLCLSPLDIELGVIPVGQLLVLMAVHHHSPGVPVLAAQLVQHMHELSFLNGAGVLSFAGLQQIRTDIAKAKHSKVEPEWNELGKLLVITVKDASHLTWTSGDHNWSTTSTTLLIAAKKYGPHNFYTKTNVTDMLDKLYTLSEAKQEYDSVRAPTPASGGGEGGGAAAFYFGEEYEEVADNEPEPAKVFAALTASRKSDVLGTLGITRRDQVPLKTRPCPNPACRKEYPCNALYHYLCGWVDVNNIYVCGECNIPQTKYNNNGQVTENGVKCRFTWTCCLGHSKKDGKKFTDETYGRIQEMIKYRNSSLVKGAHITPLDANKQANQ